MKVNMLLILATAVATLGAAGADVAKQMDETPADHLMSHQSETGQVSGDPNSEGPATSDSGATWGRHEPLENCVPCHGEQPEHGSPDKSGLVAPVPGLCYLCHEDYAALDGWVHGPVAAGECLLCHEPHKANNKFLLSKPAPDLCYQCHETKRLQLVANHLDDSYAQCNDCHEGHTSSRRMLLKQDFLKTDAGLAYVRQSASARWRPTFVDRRGSLSGLPGVKVVPVIDGSDLFARYGLTEDFVRTKVELQLRQNGVKVLRPDERAGHQSSLYVYLRLMEVPSQHRSGRVDALSGSLNIFLRQTVELLGAPEEGKRRLCTATTWDTGGIVIWGTSQIEEGLEKAVEVLVGQFSNDYLDANPKAQASAPARGEEQRLGREAESLEGKSI
jgi:predicted CXXCH cytochrome family protein